METMSHWLLLLLLACINSQSLVDSTCLPGCQSCTDDQFLCNGIGLKETPDQIPEDTMVMDLSQNEIKSLSKENLNRLSKVQSLRLAGNQIRHLQSATFESMTELVSLDLSYNKISNTADDAFQGLASVRTISFDNNQLQRIGLMFSSTQQASSISLGGNQITSIEEDDFKENRVLRMLDLSNNQIRAIHSQAFANLENLQYLVLSNNPITILPDLVFSSSKLALADFTNCELTAVPRTMPPSLRDYRLGDNKITAVELDDFRNITNLRLVILNNNKISQVAHRAFWGLESLREIWMTQNEMVYVPRGLPQGLTKLYMDFNQVSDLQPMLFPKESEMEFLTLEANNIRKIHQDAFKDVKKLQELNLQGNQISLIDIGTFTELPELRTLRLSNNPLQSIEPQSFANLQKLATLMLSYIDHRPTAGVHLLRENFLTTMPKLSFMDMTASAHLSKQLLELIGDPNTPAFPTIKHLNLRYDDLTTLPANLRSVIPNIKELILDGNLWKCDTNLLWLHDWMTTAAEETAFFSLDEPQCQSPRAVKGRTLMSLQRSEFPAPVVEPEKPAQSADETQSNPDPASDGNNGQGSEVATGDNQGGQGGQLDPVTEQTPETQPFGTRVIIKAPKTKPEDDPDNPTVEKKKKKRNRDKTRKNRKGKKRDKAKRKKDNRRKRRIRNEERRKKRCKVQPDGSLKCRKRKGKGRKNKVTTTAQPIAQV